MKSHIGNSCNELGVDLNAMQIGIRTYVFIVIVQQNGRIVHGREAQGRNADRAQETAVGVTRADMCAEFKVPVAEKESQAGFTLQARAYLQFIQCLLKCGPVRI